MEPERSTPLFQPLDGFRRNRCASLSRKLADMEAFFGPDFRSYRLSLLPPHELVREVVRGESLPAFITSDKSWIFLWDQDIGLSIN